MKTIALLGMLLVAAAGWAAEITLTTALENPVTAAGSKQITYLKVGLTGFAWDAGNRSSASLNIALVLDRSGSMEGPKLDQAREAAKTAVSLLSSRDVLSIITFESEVQVLLPATRVTDKGSIYRLIDQIYSAGSTAIFAGVSKGAAEVRKFLSRENVNRVILMSDGLANVGPDSPDAMADLGTSLRKEGITVSTIGLGLDYNEDLMTRLAQAADGNHAFVQEPKDLVRIFNLEFKDALSIVAKDLRVKIDFTDGVRPLRLLNRDGAINGQSVTLDLSQIAANQEKYFLVEVELPALAASSKKTVCSVQASYLNLVTKNRSNIASSADVRATTNLAEVDRNRRADVAEAVGVQKAVEASQKAVELRDLGKSEEAKQVLEKSAEELKKLGAAINSAPVAAAAAQNEADSKAIADEEQDYNKLRKNMRAKEHSDANQQSYQ